MTEDGQIDGPDSIWFEGVGDIPIFDEDDFRLEQDRDQATYAETFVQALGTVSQLRTVLLTHPQEEVRWRVVARFIAKGSHCPSLVSAALIDALRSDPSWMVRDAAAMGLLHYSNATVYRVLRDAADDENETVRETIQYVLTQMHFDLNQ